ncbi:hypothetical protein BDK51DRAFT_37414 [Blyttiomyces helicus]|uniref:Kinesin motor domain-containing protein n=1 Tax=Blyttiomyces helicus TaxID=388810 RepID=A0A4P9VVB5_9FUNG|nr:hypothetical protein BDK51DRAFT_37414 [Blyttiomyces helicus]|eukprot:RKO83062.1 hypothetical protein BDK51DRAFT_37414 [Blyttiomyces helicus]
MSPAIYNYDETLSTLRYANRAKSIKNKPKVNEDPKDAMLREYQEEIQRLKEVLMARQAGGGGTGAEREVITRIVKKQVMKKVVRKVPRRRVERREVEGGEESAEEEEVVVVEEEEEEEEEDEEEERGGEERGGGDADGASGVEPDAVGAGEASASGSTSRARTASISGGGGGGRRPSVNALSQVPPETLALLQAQVESEKRALLASKDMVVEEKQRIAEELNRRAQELEAERRVRDELATKLAALEGKLLVGGVEIEHRVHLQERELEEREAQLEEQLRKERELQSQLESRQEAQLQMEESYASLQEEVDVKSRKLKKLWAKLQAAKAEISDLHDEFRSEREDLADTIRELTRECGLKMAIIDNFIPHDERAKIERRAVYDEERDDWRLAALTSINLDKRVRRPIAAAGARRPISQYGKTVLGMGEAGVRYRGENILTLKLDLPERTTFQSSPTKSLRAPSALDYVFAGDEGDEIMVSDMDLPATRGGTSSDTTLDDPRGDPPTSAPSSRRPPPSDQGQRAPSAKKKSTRSAGAAAGDAASSGGEYPASRSSMKPKGRYA